MQLGDLGVTSISTTPSSRQPATARTSSPPA